MQLAIAYTKPTPVAETAACVLCAWGLIPGVCALMAHALSALSAPQAKENFQGRVGQAKPGQQVGLPRQRAAAAPRRMRQFVVTPSHLVKALGTTPAPLFSDPHFTHSSEQTKRPCPLCGVLSDANTNSRQQHRRSRYGFHAPSSVRNMEGCVIPLFVRPGMRWAAPCSSPAAVSVLLFPCGSMHCAGLLKLCTDLAY